MNERTTPPPTPPRRGEGRRVRPQNIVVGQRVDAAKVQRARELRRHMTLEVRILWQALRANRLQGLQFRRQQIIDGFIVDFYCHAAGLVVAVDGPVHDHQPGDDAERDEILSGRGIRVMRVRNDEVRRDLPAVLDRIMTCAAKGLAGESAVPPHGGTADSPAKVADGLVKGLPYR